MNEESSTTVIANTAAILSFWHVVVGADGAVGIRTSPIIGWYVPSSEKESMDHRSFPIVSNLTWDEVMGGAVMNSMDRSWSTFAGVSGFEIAALEAELKLQHN